MEMGFCQKFQEEVPFSEGCRHPKDYCPYRQACMVYLFGKERKKGRDFSRESENPPH